MEKAIREDAPGPAAPEGLDIDVAALVAHTRPLGADELDELLDGDRDILDAAEEATPHSAVCEALAMLAVEKQLQPLVGAEAWRLVVRRCDLGGDAELVTRTERFALCWARPGSTGRPWGRCTSGSSASPCPTPAATPPSTTQQRCQPPTRRPTRRMSACSGS
ncbi:MAG: hypothetical protein ACRD0D_12230 [Acidimicrobiales bacterium]